MTYCRVKPQFDGKAFYRVNGRHLEHAGNLVQNELFTEREMIKKNILLMYNITGDEFEYVDIPKNRVYWVFGSRFEYGRGCNSCAEV